MFWIVLTVIAALVSLGAVLVAVASQTDRAPAIGTALITFVLWGLLSGFLSASTVENGHIGVKKQFGSLVGTTGEGFVTKAPWQSLEEVSVQDEMRTYVMDDRREEGTGSAVSKDSQPVFLDVQVRYMLLRDKVVPLYRQTGGKHIERILDPAVFQNTKEITAAYKAIDFAANREKIRLEIEQTLNAEVEPFGIIIKNVTLKNVDFTDALSNAIEQTVEAEQQAKRAQAQVEIKEAEAEQAIAVAQGEAQSQIERAEGQARATLLAAQAEAKAIAVKGHALRRYPETLRLTAIEKLNPNVQTMLIPSDQGLILDLKGLTQR